MTATGTHRDRHASAGFSLLEVVIALAVLAIALLSLTALRTESLVTAAEARNLRVARSLADRVISEVKAGLLRAYDVRGQVQTDEQFAAFSYKILVGELAIQQEESAETEATADASGLDSDYRRLERLRWLQQRQDIRKARELKVPTHELTKDEVKEPDVPDEETFEDFAVFVYYPSYREEGKSEVYRVRSRTTTLALSGLTSEQANERKGRTSGGEEAK
jgi:prepilin-type N-terminal cleavage/methylation domain-containing protein